MQGFKKKVFIYKSGFVVSFQVLHYAQELFEGMKAYRGVDDQIRMFRPMHNMARYKHELVGARHLKESPLTIFLKKIIAFLA